MQIILSICTLASASTDGTSLMQRRLISQHNAHSETEKGQTGKEVDARWEEDHSRVNDVASSGSEHICGTWTEWTECSATCGGGVMTRTYNFEDGASCGKSCPHGNGDKQQRSCNLRTCPVDCEGEWSNYSSCSVTCGGGVQTRTFRVTREASHGGAPCEVADGSTMDSKCSTQPCEKNCKGHWDDWSECTGPGGKKCGLGGTQHRTYSVTQEHTAGGCGCEAAMFADNTTKVSVNASTVDTRVCTLQCCPEPCEGSWGSWSQCTGPDVQMMAPAIPTYGYTGGEIENCCGGGMKERSFTVTKDSVCNGAPCSEANGQLETTSCCETPCPVDCEGDWGEPGICSSPCGGGMHERVFIITQEALHGGKNCTHKANDIKQEECNKDIPCPIDCEGYWDEWQQCTAKCGSEGTQSRRWIVTVQAEHGGVQCTELGKSQLRSCDPEPAPCPVDAVCTWTEYGDCNATCYDTENPMPIMKNRSWVELSPALHGGVECKHTPPECEEAYATCQLPKCKIHCEGEWGEYTTCNAAKVAACEGEPYFCGRGTQTKTFTITKAAQYGGQECPFGNGENSSRDCGDTPCPVNCEGNWTDWTDCCSTCGGGSQSRDYVISVAAQHGGCDCKPAAEQPEHRACNEHACPIDCEGSWSAYGECNQTCTDCRNGGAAGIKQSTFGITVEAQHGGKPCAYSHGATREMTCNAHCCPEDCEGSWSEFGKCSTTCGNGVTERTYTVTHKEAHGGKPCPYCDKASNTTACTGTSPCPIDCSGAMTDWSNCNRKCGGGTQTAYFIQNVVAQHGGKKCTYGQFQLFTRECNIDACPQRCLGAFGPWGACSADCSGGTKARNFTVYRQAASGGENCKHADGDVETALCNEHDCPEGYVCPKEQTCKYSNGLIQRR